MAKRRKDDNIVSDSSMSFGEAFQSVMSKECEQEINNLPQQVFCSTDNTLLDTILGGGLLSGNYHVFAAPAHSGKSTTCIRTIARFLRDFPNGNVLWIDSEQATSEKRLMELGIPYVHQKDSNNQNIVDKDGLPLPMRNKNNNIIWDSRFFRIPTNVTMERAFELIDKCIEVKINYNMEQEPLMVVFDSLDSMPSTKETECDNADQAIGVRSKILNFNMRKYLQKISRYNICIIFIQHIGKKLSMQGPYESYDGRMSSLKDFTITGGKALQFYPHSMVTFRARLGNTISKELSDYGIDNGFIVEATTLKSKSFSFNLVVPLVFDTLRGFSEYATRYYNMKDNDWFHGTVSKSLPEFPDDKFNAKTFFAKLKEEPEFKAKVDLSWNNYLETTYRKHRTAMAMMNTSQQNIDISDIDDNVMVDTLHEFIESGEIGETSSQTVNTMAMVQENDSIIESDNIDLL